MDKRNPGMHPRSQRLSHALASLVLLACVLPAAAKDPDTIDIASALLGENRRVEVTLPASYAWATERRFPVLYLLDGQTHGGHAVASSAFLAAQGQLPELIVVSVHSTVRVRDFTQTDWPQAWIGGGGAANFTRFLLTELLPRIERDYRVSPFRILAGNSASGQYVLHQLATQPGEFHAYLAIAPSLDWDGQLPIRELESALPRADRPARFVYFAYGDDREQALADDLRLARALAAAAPGSLRAQVRAFPGETHSALPLLGLIDGLRALYAGYALPEDLAAKGPLAVDAHYATLSTRLGTPVAAPEAALIDVGYQLLGSKRVAEAIAVFERVARENPNSANAWDSLAEALEQGARLDDALRASRRALELATRFGLPNRASYERNLLKLQQKAQSGAAHRSD
jgi:predicted alpha/beta superfamily hydrolase